MPVPDNLCHDFDATALSLGLTLKLDERGRVIPIGPADNPNIPDDRAPFYVVWVGRGVGLFRNWGTTNAMVCGFSGSTFKLYEGI
uniref:Bifunctional solanapyrone synthase (Prosolanapyrone-II oxidase) (Prosolanapyrone-III cycloisomerase) (Solanapyrone biosynthesis protein 5))) n=1 Tax=Ganoderma boninense TaxID=34458 RepID=A0A5K1JZI1_9APHY|nr:Bifunctional solanapyrone synthase (EC (EC (FAD-dependent monooxygenase sol5) (Prosolanapyrone-II oxidase) (Prosolanapyrone-III cycloisomerase) (Solanapyrone biosynthesis protein 5) [Ganoderma boninense]